MQTRPGNCYACPTPFHSPYPVLQVSLSRVGGAVENLVRAVASELAPRRINVVSPGLIETPMFGEAGEARSAKMVHTCSNGMVSNHYKGVQKCDTRKG